MIKMTNTSIKQLIDSVELVSFDIFDTLIYRIYNKPVDLFMHMEESTKLAGFAKARIDAEAFVREKAKKNGTNEISLEEIYEEIHVSFQTLITLEEKLEIQACYCNQEMHNIFQYAVQQGKKIVLASDMYLPARIIKAILQNSGYTGFHKLFLSSETLRPKATGEMFEDIWHYSELEKNQILHIGDHVFTDSQVPIKFGIKAYHYVTMKASYMENSSFFATLEKYNKKSVVPSILTGIIEKNFEKHREKDYWYQFGYKYAGIMAYAFANWVKAQVEKYHIEQVLFLVGDGHLFKEVFDFLFPDIKSSYLYASRRCYLMSSSTSIEDIIDALFSETLTCSITYKNFYDSLTIEHKEFEKSFFTCFPQQDALIKSQEDIKILKQFFSKNQDILLEVCKNEREVAIKYFLENKLNERKTAFIDLGWDGSILNAINSTLKIAKINPNIIGLYFGTHEHKQKNGVLIRSFTIHDGKPKNKMPFSALLDHGFVIQIMRLIFSAPHSSILKLVEKNGKIVPFFQNIFSDETKKRKISKEVTSGVLDFTKDYQNFTEEAKLEISNEVSIVAAEYFKETISKSDLDALCEIQAIPELDNKIYHYPISKSGAPTFGVINQWPGSMSAEAEVIIRIQKGAAYMGYKCITLSALGEILDGKQQKTGRFINPKKLDFIINLHYEASKVLDTFYYYAIWNPAEILLGLPYYSAAADNCMTYDDYLIYGKGGMVNHLDSILLNSPRTIEGASSLVASFSKDCMLEPKAGLNKPNLFYCGMNWEKIVHGTNRHQGLFQLLDKTGKVKFFGPDKNPAWGGVAPWEGYKSYQYSIPFDAVSILKEINKCGVVLVLSSDIHRKAAAATSRVYEACAGGALIISDDNPFVQEHFQNAALFINYYRSEPEKTFKEIMAKLRWVEENKEEALKLIKNAQKIYLEKFALEKQLHAIVQNHSERKKVLHKDLFAKSKSKIVLVSYVIDTLSLKTAKSYLKNVIENIENQHYQSIILAVICDNQLFSELDAWCIEKSARAKIFPMVLFHNNNRCLTDGQAIGEIQKKLPHDYYINTLSNEIWFSDHITTMLRCFEDNSDAKIVISGRLKKSDKISNIDYFDNINCKKLYNMESLPCPGQVLICKDVENCLPASVFEYIDGYEHYAYLLVAILKFNMKSIFTKRLTFNYTEDANLKANLVISKNMQKNYIQHLVRFSQTPDFFSESVNNTTNLIDSSSLDAMWSSVFHKIKYLPLRSYIKLRYYLFRMRFCAPQSKKYQKLHAQFVKHTEQFDRFCDNLRT